MNETQRAIINEAKGILRDCQRTIKGRLALLPRDNDKAAAEDIKATKALQSWLEPLGVTVVDHLIFTQGEWTDMRGNWK